MSQQTRALVLGLTATLIGFPLISWIYFLSHMVPDGHTDFRATYTAGYMLRTGKPLYNLNSQHEAQNRTVSPEENVLPFNHPAYEALIYLPLSFFSYIRAYWIWFTLNLLMLGGVYYALRDELAPLSDAARWVPIASLAAYLPFGAAVVQGQDSVLFTLLFVLAFAQLRDKNNLVRAGMFLGFAAFRFHLLIPVVVCFLCWRKWKLIAGLLSSGLPVVLLSVMLGGFGNYIRILMIYSGQGTRGGIVEPMGLQHIVSLMPNLRGLIQSCGGGPGLIACASLLVFGITVIAGRQLDDPREQLALAISAATLISYHGLIHDLSVLFVACALILSKNSSMALPMVGVAFFTPTLLIFAPRHFYLAAFGELFFFVYLVASLNKVSTPHQPLQTAMMTHC